MIRVLIPLAFVAALVFMAREQIAIPVPGKSVQADPGIEPLSELGMVPGPVFRETAAEPSITIRFDRLQASCVINRSGWGDFPKCH